MKSHELSKKIQPSSYTVMDSKFTITAITTLKSHLKVPENFSEMLLCLLQEKKKKDKVGIIGKTMRNLKLEIAVKTYCMPLSEQQHGLG